MEKHAFPIAIAVLLAAFIALLTASCGEGEPNNLAEDQLESAKIKKAMDSLTNPDYGAIKGCVNGGPGCPEEKNRQSSSSEEGASSNDGYSSTSGNASAASSSGGDVNGGDDSSSGASNISSPSKPPEFNDDCPADVQLLFPNFTCFWNPAIREAGDSSKLSLSTYTVPGNMSCTPSPKGAWRALFGCNEGVTPENCIKRDTAYFPLDKNIATSGLYLDMKNNGKNLTETSKSWPKSGNFVVNGTLVCTGIGYSCRKTVPCVALDITPATPPDSSNVSLTCDWTTLPEGTNNLAKGTNLTACELKAKDGGWLIPNSSAAGCKTTPAIQYCGGSALGSCDASKVGTIVVKAVVTCKGGDYTLKTLTYNVVADPILSGGSCIWNVENNVYLGGATPTFGTPVPTVINNYGRCSTTPVLSQNGTSVYTTLPNVPQGTQQKVNLKAYPACPAGTPYGAGIQCPEITVKNVADACDYVAATHCPGVTNKASIITAAQNCPGTGTCGDNSRGKCFYATSITKMAAANGTSGNDRVTINGNTLSTNNGNCANDGQWSLPTCTSALSSIAKVDGGYYIYVYSNAWTDNGFTTTNTNNGLHPNCR